MSASRKPVRIKYILPVPLNEEGIARRAAQVPTESLRPDTRVDCVPVKNSVSGMSEGAYHDLVLEMYVVEAGLSAEDEGYDAVVMDTISDSGLAALRSRLTIPVVGPGQVYYTIATLLGKRFSVLVMWDPSKHFHEKNLTLYGLWDKCASIRSIGIKADPAKLLEGKEDEVFPKLAETAKRCVEEDGADVILLGSTTMHTAGEYLSAHISVPIINPGPVAIKMAETLVELGLSHSKVAYSGTTSPAVEDAKFHSLAGAAAS